MEQLQEQWSYYQEYGTCMQQHLFEHFSWRDTIVFLKMSLLHRLTKLTHQTLYRERELLEKYSEDNDAMGTER